MAQDLGIVQPIADGLQAIGNKVAEVAGKGVGAALGGLGALLAMIPGMSSIGESIASVGAAGARDNPMEDNHHIEIASHARVQEHAPGIEKIVEKPVTLAGISASLSDDVKQQMGAAIAVLNKAPGIAAQMFETAQNHTGAMLGTGAEHGVAIAAVSAGRDMGGRTL